MQSVERTPEFHLAMAGARHWTARATQASFDRAMMRARNQVARQERESRPRPPAKLLDEGSHLTIAFSANNHGEREDCGCKRNPLGGLTRRATMLSLIAGEKGASDPRLLHQYWEVERGEEVVLHPGTLFVADAGDLLFPHTTVKSAPESSRKLSMSHAEAVIAALSHAAPDVVNVGEHDLAMGLDALEGLAREATFPFISANLKRADGSAPFAGHHIVERGDSRVAFIGLIKPRARHKDYYLQQGVSVEDPFEAYVREVAKLPKTGIDLVVLLSNEGVKNTELLVPRIVARGARLDAVIASGSNMLTKRAHWIEGVPIVEPMSQGKHLGRIDVVLRGEAHEPPDFINESANRLELLDDYRAAWSSYLQTRYAVRRQQEAIAREEVVVSSGQAPTMDARETKRPGTRRKDRKLVEPDEQAPLTAAQLEQNKARARLVLKKKQEELVLLESRLELTSKEAVRLAALLDEDEEGAGGAARGDDWFEMRIVPVLLEIPQEPNTRKTLDRFEK